MVVGTPTEQVTITPLARFACRRLSSSVVVCRRHARRPLVLSDVGDLPRLDPSLLIVALRLRVRVWWARCVA